MRKGEHLKLGAFFAATGQHLAAWRLPEVNPDGGVNLKEYVDIARIAERGLFDMIFFADNAGIWNRDLRSNGRSSRAAYFEPITLLSALAAVTERVGLVATATTTFNEPFNVARKFASLDHLSGGRAGWNLVTSGDESAALNFGYDVHMPHEDRYRRAREFAEVVLGLWDSWEDDAFVRDQASGLFFDPSKMHTLDYRGQCFTVRGPLNISRTPQGRPIVVQSGSSADGKDLGAYCADIIFTVEPDLKGGIALYQDIKSRLSRFGRSPRDLKIMPGLSPVIGRTRAEAQAKFQRLQELIDPAVGLGQLTAMAGVDFTRYPLDEPFPDIPEMDNDKGRFHVLKETARRDNLTVRQLYMHIAGTKGHHLVIGTASDVADVMEEWFHAGAADGFNVMPQTLPGCLTDFVDGVIPELQRRGLFRTAYEGRTLRDNLGLAWPETRHAKARSPARRL